jgi:Domain of unknown function (DUF4112)
MSKVSGEPWTIHHDAEFARREALARNLERLAWLMDRAFHIPGTRIRVGLDALLGLFPVGGDVLTGLVQAGLVLVALRHYKVPRIVAARMAANVLIDIAVGSIPLLGDLFDIGFKANTRNVQLLESYRHPEPTEFGPPGTPRTISIDLSPVRFKPPWRLILPIAAVLLIGLVLVLVGFITVVRWLFHF